MVDVAQLVRASVCGTEGRGFESRLPPHPSLYELRVAGPICILRVIVE